MRNIEIVELLLDKGAKVSAVDKVKSNCWAMWKVKSKIVVEGWPSILLMKGKRWSA